MEKLKEARQAEMFAKKTLSEHSEIFKHTDDVLSEHMLQLKRALRHVNEVLAAIHAEGGKPQRYHTSEDIKKVLKKSKTPMEIRELFDVCREAVMEGLRTESTITADGEMGRSIGQLCGKSYKAHMNPKQAERGFPNVIAVERVPNTLPVRYRIVDYRTKEEDPDYFGNLVWHISQFNKKK